MYGIIVLDAMGMYAKIYDEFYTESMEDEKIIGYTKKGYICINLHIK